MNPLVYRISEVAALMGMSKSTVRRMIADGEMPAVRYGRTIRIPRWWVDERIGRAA